MRSTNDWNLQHRTVQFCGDLPGGGCRVETPCGQLLDTVLMLDSETPFYDLDGEEVFYPGWAEW